MSTTVRDLKRLLNAPPTPEAWSAACPSLAGLDQEDLAEITPYVLTWPAEERPMPGDWWEQWTSGDRRPCHALAGTRRLGDPIGDLGFSEGTAAVAAASDLTRLWLAECPDWPRVGGDIACWSTLEATVRASFGAAADVNDRFDKPHDLRISPDGRLLVAAFEHELRAWNASSGAPAWAHPVSWVEHPPADADPTDPSEWLRRSTRLEFSADGRRVAVDTAYRADGAPRVAGAVCVLDAGTGDLLFDVPHKQEPVGPVALDAHGDLLAFGARSGQVVLRRVPTSREGLGEGHGESDAVIGAAYTGLSAITALAFAPDGTSLLVVGNLTDWDETAESAYPASVPRAPAARVIDLEISATRAALTRRELVRPAGFPVRMDAGSPDATRSSRAIWTDRGAYAFVGDDHGSLLFDAYGTALWAGLGGELAAFTPDGSALVTVDDADDVRAIDAWFLDGLTRPDARADADQLLLFPPA